MSEVTEGKPRLASSEILELWITRQQDLGVSDSKIAEHAFSCGNDVLTLTKSKRKGAFNLVTNVGCIDLQKWYATDGGDV